MKPLIFVDRQSIVQLVSIILFFLVIAYTPIGYGANHGGDDNRYKISYQRLLNDQRIEQDFTDGLRWQDDRFSKARVKVKVYNGFVLIYGEVPSKDLVDKAEQHALRLKDVRKTFNQLTVAIAQLPATLDDLILSAKIKSYLWTSTEADAARVRYAVDGHTVYLMGLLNAEDAQYVTDLVKDIDEVQKVVTLFEYVK